MPRRGDVSDLGRRFRINKAVAMSHPKYALTLGDPVFYVWREEKERKGGRKKEKENQLLWSL